MTIDQFRSLSACVEAEELFGEAPASCAYVPLQGTALELVELGYLVADGGADGIIGLSVTPAGRMALAQ